MIDIDIWDMKFLNIGVVLVIMIGKSFWLFLICMEKELIFDNNLLVCCMIYFFLNYVSVIFLYDDKLLIVIWSFFFFIWKVEIGKLVCILKIG